MASTCAEVGLSCVGGACVSQPESCVALEFDGGDDFVALPELDLTGSFTIEMMVYIHELAKHPADTHLFSQLGSESNLLITLRDQGLWRARWRSPFAFASLLRESADLTASMRRSSSASSRRGRPGRTPRNGRAPVVRERACP